MAFETKLPLNLDDFVVKTKLSDAQYLFGFLVAITAFGLVETASAGRVYNILRVPERLPKDELRAEINGLIERRPDMKEFIVERLSSVESYFRSAG